MSWVGPPEGTYSIPHIRRWFDRGKKKKEKRGIRTRTRGIQLSLQSIRQCCKPVFHYSTDEKYRCGKRLERKEIRLGLQKDNGCLSGFQVLLSKRRDENNQAK
jgi:hypothetical protein